MTSTLFLGLDIGTTTKAVAFTEAGDPVATATANTWRAMAPTGAETTAQDLVDSAPGALASRLDHCPPGQIAGPRVTAESGALTDRSGTPIGPVIAWHDSRDTAELADLRAGFGDDISPTTTCRCDSTGPSPSTGGWSASPALLAGIAAGATTGTNVFPACI